MFKVAWGPAKILTFADSLAANGGHMTLFQPMKHKWVSAGHSYEPPLLPSLSFLSGNEAATLEPAGDEPVDEKECAEDEEQKDRKSLVPGSSMMMHSWLCTACLWAPCDVRKTNLSSLSWVSYYLQLKGFLNDTNGLS